MPTSENLQTSIDNCLTTQIKPLLGKLSQQLQQLQTEVEQNQNSNTTNTNGCELVKSVLDRISNIIPKNFCPKICPDVCVGEMEEIGKIDEWTDVVKKYKTIVYKKRKPNPSKKSKNHNCILILESPHQDEYPLEKGHVKNDSISPARGATGENIKAAFSHITDWNITLSNGTNSDISSYNLILMNAVPYQCSLGVDTKLFRDIVFRKLWDMGAKELFVERFKKIYKNGDLVLNCCTDGNSKPTLKKLVHDAILQVNGVNNYYELYHPAFRNRTDSSKSWAAFSDTSFTELLTDLLHSCE